MTILDKWAARKITHEQLTTLGRAIFEAPESGFTGEWKDAPSADRIWCRMEAMNQLLKIRRAVKSFTRQLRDAPYDAMRNDMMRSWWREANRK